MHGTKLALFTVTTCYYYSTTQAIGAASWQTTIPFHSSAPPYSTLSSAGILRHHLKTQRLVYLSTVYSAITTNYRITLTPMHDFSRPCAVLLFRRQLSLNKNAITFLIKQMRRTDQAQHKLDWLIFFLFSFLFPTFTYDWSSLGVDTRSGFQQASTQTKANPGLVGLLPIWSVPARIRRFEPDSQNRIESSRSNFTHCKRTIYSYNTIALDRSRLIVYRCPYRVSLCLTHHPHPAFPHS